MNPSLNRLLQQTSRSFYLTLRILPRAIRPQIGLAYLLARIADTIADTEIVPVPRRLEALQSLRERILGANSIVLNFGELAQSQGLPAERRLLEQVEAALAVLPGLTEVDLQLVRQVIDTITSGQELDLRRFGNAVARPDVGTPTIIALESEAELDDYTYRVAGCVGKFWTEMCLAHLFRQPKSHDSARPSFEELGIRFGKGLQLVNILRDLPVDLRSGRCYVPRNELAKVGLAPGDLLSPANEAKFRPLYDSYLDLAASHLAAGWEYTNRIRWGQVRVRLACAWPVLIGVATIQRLRREAVLDPARRVKISRPELRRILWRSVWRYPTPRSWRRLGNFPLDDDGKAVARARVFT